jgi:pantoate--beta-alanine ligase
LKAAEKELRAGVRDGLALQHAMRKVLDGEKHARVDYAEIVDAETFEPVARVERTSYAVLAVRIGNTRLIDNMLMHAGYEVSIEL